MKKTKQLSALKVVNGSLNVIWQIKLCEILSLIQGSFNCAGVWAMQVYQSATTWLLYPFHCFVYGNIDSIANAQLY